ncbi:hypothetical protein D3C81_1704040 [compost metagenome]
MTGFICTDFQVQHVAQFGRINAIDDETQAVCDEWILDVLDDAFEAEQTFASCDDAPRSDVLDQGRIVVILRHEDLARHFDALYEVAPAALQQDRAYGANHDDDERCRLYQRTQCSALEQLPEENPAQRQCYTN